MLCVESYLLFRLERHFLLGGKYRLLRMLLRAARLARRICRHRMRRGSGGRLGGRHGGDHRLGPRVDCAVHRRRLGQELARGEAVAVLRCAQLLLRQGLLERAAVRERPACVDAAAERLEELRRRGGCMLPRAAVVPCAQPRGPASLALALRRLVLVLLLLLKLGAGGRGVVGHVAEHLAHRAPVLRARAREGRAAGAPDARRAVARRRGVHWRCESIGLHGRQSGAGG